MGMVPGNIEWLLAFIYAVAPGIVAWSVSGDFSLAWLRGFLPGVAPAIFAWTDSKDFARSGSGDFSLEWLRTFLPGVVPRIFQGSSSRMPKYTNMRIFSFFLLCACSRPFPWPVAESSGSL